MEQVISVNIIVIKQRKIISIISTNNKKRGKDRENKRKRNSERERERERDCRKDDIVLTGE